MDDMQTDNVFQLGLLNLVFELLSLFINTLTDVIIPGILTPLLQAVFGLFQ